MGGIVLLLDIGGAFTGVPSYLISSCEIAQSNERFLEKEEACGSTNFQSESPESSSQTQSPPKKGKQAHQSQQAPPAPPSESRNHSPTTTRILQQVTPRKKKQLPLPSFSPSLFSSSALLPFLFTSSQIFLYSFFLLSSLPTRSSLSQLIKKFSSCIALYSLTTSQSFPLQDSMGLSVPLILPTHIHLTVFCIPS